MFGDGDFVFVGQQFDGIYFVYVYVYWVGGVVIFGVECVQCGGGFFGCGVIDFVVVGVVIVE